MKLLHNCFHPNGLIHEPTKTMSDSLINFPSALNSDDLKDVEYIRPLLDYSESWNINSDIFQYLKEEPLNRLRNGQCILVFDASMEGFSPYEIPFARSLYLQSLKYNIDPRRIYLLTGNFKENECYNNYLALNGLSVGINIVETTIVGDMVLPRDVETFEDHVRECQQHHTDKIFLQLSRRNRPYRIMANYLMDNSPIRHYGLISQDKVTVDEKNFMFYEYRKSPHADDDITEREFDRWNNDRLPLTVDNTDFQVNWANWSSPIIHHRTLFSVVLETSMRDLGGTAMFASEKIFKPIIHRQPFIVFGHRGINSYLRSMGFRTYEQWFDISQFDLETDPVVRFRKIKECVTNAVDHLKNLSIQERVKWRFMNQDILDHNYNLLMHRTLRQREANNLHSTIKSYFFGQFFSQLAVSPSSS